MTKSSAYRTNLALTYTGHLFAMACSRHSSALLVTNGEITPPCGVPSSDGKSSFPSIIPALSHPLIARLILSSRLVLSVAYYGRYDRSM